MSGDGYGNNSRERWRDQFNVADQLPVTALAEEKRQRGRDFEQILLGMFTEAELAPRIRFRPIGEEIDGSFFHRDKIMLLEAKWTQDPLPASSIYQFRGKIEGKLIGTIGVFISMSGFSADAVDALVAGKVVNTILFSGDDMRAVASDQIGFAAALDQKLRAAAETGTPFLPLRDPVSRRLSEVVYKEGPLTKLVVVEGAFDVLLVHALADEFGPPAYRLEVLPAGGTFNLAAISHAARRVGNRESVVIVADGDGNPSAVRNRIEAGLGASGSETAGQTDILVLDPTFEEALGIFDGSATARRRVLGLDRRLLQDKLRAADIRQVAANNLEVQRLLSVLGLDR